jgi:FixJ family two-component response regulator
MRDTYLFCLLAISVVWANYCGAAAPDDEPVKYDLMIDRQPLGQALQAFAKQSRTQIIFFSQLTTGFRSPALHGQYTIAEALTLLLKESGLSYRVINPTTIEIRPRRQGAEMNDLEQIEVEPTVYVVDDDPRICEALGGLFRSRGIQVVTFRSAAGYLAYPRPDGPGCVILDVGLPDISGLELQSRIAGSNHAPVVFITGDGDVPTTVRALKAGAVDFLTKPFREQDLMAAFDAAIARDRIARRERVEQQRLLHLLARLTPRERQVLPLVVDGLLNKQAAQRLGISAITLQIHRSRVMHKMQAGSLPELVRIAGKLPVALSAQGL